MAQGSLASLTTIQEDVTDEAHGKKPDDRSVGELLDYGIILLDKPAGPTSHEVVAWIRKMLNIQKAGHSGTLDPPVTGLLPIGLGEATKALSALLLGPKEYYAVARLHNIISSQKIASTLKEFTGEIYQRPPQRSSVKRVTRTRSIYALDVVEQSERLLLLRVLCQAGTYVRKLIYDWGEVLGTGATMAELRRTRVSQLNEGDGFIRLHNLADAYQTWSQEGSEEALRKCVRPIEFALSSLKSVVVRDSAVDAICHGAQLAIPGILKISPDIAKEEPVAIYSLKGEIIALGEAVMSSDTITTSDKGIAVLTRRVIMKPSTYPRLWKTTKQT